MTYLAMARKWRPEKFSDMVGQDHIAKTLENAIRENRLHHGYLFTGTRGVGKTTSARILAKMINCTGDGQQLPCNQCDSCKQITSGNSMDVIETDGASNNGVDDVRDLIEQVKYAPMHGKYKIFIIDEVHMLTKAAFNALLKTLEEPPPHVVFIFATTESSKIPQTILSRIQRYDFKRIGPQQIIDRMSFIAEQEKINSEKNALTLIAELADGSMRDALTLFDQVFAFSGSNMSEESTKKVLGIPSQDLYFTLLGHIAEHDQKGCFQSIEEFFQKGIEVSVYLNGFSRFLRNVLLARIDKTALVSESTEDTIKRLENIGSHFQTGDLLRLGRMINDLYANVMHSSQPRITVEMGFARMAYLDRVIDLRKALAVAPVANSTESTEKKKL